MLAAKDEKDATGAVLFFNAAHYGLRPWPWIIVALCSLVVFPNLKSLQAAFPNMPADKIGHDLAYPAMLKKVLPAGWFGLVLASLTAAYMSTISTHLNWGSSYVVNDFYKRFVKPAAPEKKLVRVGRISTVLMMVVAGWIALQLTNALQAFQILMQIGAGTGLLFILPWFWWRINAISELVAMVVSFVIAVLFQALDNGLESWQQLIIGVGITTIAWIAATLFTKPADEQTLKSFCKKTNPGGRGWTHVYAAIKAEGGSVEGDAVNLPRGILCMVLGCAFVYAALFSTGFWLYGQVVFRSPSKFKLPVKPKTFWRSTAGNIVFQGLDGAGCIWTLPATLCPKKMSCGYFFVPFSNHNISLKYTGENDISWSKEWYKIMIKRKSEQYLKHWFDKTRRKPLVLRGARQVGKSTLVRQFAEHHGLVLNEINLEKHLLLDDIFKSLDIKRIVQELEGLLGRNILESGSLLFLDEVQATPHALAALRYFYEELPELPVIAAGSLLEFSLAKHSFPMPVGRVEYHHISPVSFSEFIDRLEPDLNSWREAAGRFEEIPETAHQRLLARLREYLFVGGMPEAVLEFHESGSLSEVQEVQRSIVETYQDDFSKYAQHAELVRLQRIFGQIPRNIGRKIKYVNLSREERSREIKAGVELLSRAQVCQKVTASHCSGPPLSAEASDDIYKLIFMDVGIVNYLCGGRWNDISEATAQVLVNEGPLAEQFVGQHLACLDRGKPQLNYWLREGRANNAEVDYVISQGMKILPVEVKSGASGSLKSLQQFVLEKGSEQALRFDLNPPSKMRIDVKARSGGSVEDVQFELLSLPLYAVESLPLL